ncbi:hypothetical protein FRB96_001406 [Tulasnella sp. 330]|nr:hypothetical protein FRB96_001406 [Tulasnella sp. 330]KAG8878234.1 hypothetical protein FRB97_002692 [Tulasnella sp. 331]
MPSWSAMACPFVVLAIVWVANRIAQYKRNIQLIKDYPGYRYMGPGGKLFHGVLPTMVKLGIETSAIWHSKHEDCVRYGWEVISDVNLRFSQPKFYISDPRILNHMMTVSRSKFPKPHHTYKILEVYGVNVISSEGSVWARHRRISSPAFSESMAQLAWEQSIRVVNEMFDTDWDKRGDRILLNRVEEPLKDITMLVFMAAAFGYIEDWISQKPLPLGHTMTFRNSLQLVLRNWFIIGGIPRFLWSSAQNRKEMKPGTLAGGGWLGKRMQETAISYAELGRYMREMVHDYQTSNVEVKRERRDVFSVLTAAIESEKESTRMTMDDVFGNMFAFLIAGHETTAHSLTYAFGLLALEEEEQDRLFEHIKVAVGERELEYPDFAKLDRVMGVLYEAMRLFPPVISIPKFTTEDAFFMVDPALSESELADPAISEERKTRRKEVFIPKGSDIGVNASALHYNPKYWSDPHRFNPERYMKKEWPKEAFLGFSLGPRQCLGRKFAEVESVATIVLILRRYKISVDTSKCPEVPGETKMARRYRLLQGDPIITLTPKPIPPPSQIPSIKIFDQNIADVAMAMRSFAVVGHERIAEPARQRNALVPTHCLPVEIITQIFTYVVDEGSQPELPKPRERYNKVHVLA